MRFLPCRAYDVTPGDEGTSVMSDGGDECIDGVMWLGVAWPHARAQMIATLRGRGASRESAEDIVQQVAERLLRRQEPFPGADDAARWCNRVAANVLVDEHRRQVRIADVVAPARPDSENVETRVLARLDLDAVHEAFSQLTSSEREALRVEPIGGSATSGAAMRRLRARRRLMVLSGLVNGVLAILLWLRRGLGRAARAVSAATPASPAIPIVPLFVAGVFVALLPLEADDRHRSADSVRREVTAPMSTGQDDRDEVVGERAVIGPAPIGARVDAGDPDVVPEPGPRAGSTRIAEVGPPWGDPVIVVEEPEVAEDEEPPTLCLGNAPVVGTRCVDRGERIPVDAPVDLPEQG